MIKLLIACDASAAGRGCWQCAGCQSCSEEVAQSARVCSWNEAAACWCEWGIAPTGIATVTRAQGQRSGHRLGCSAREWILWTECL